MYLKYLECREKKKHFVYVVRNTISFLNIKENWIVKILFSQLPHRKAIIYMYTYVYR